MQPSTISAPLEIQEMAAHNGKLLQLNTLIRSPSWEVTLGGHRGYGMGFVDFRHQFLARDGRIGLLLL